MLHGDSDFSSFNRSGYPALHPFEDVYASSPFIHTRQDVLGVSVNNLEQSKRFAEINLAAVAHLAGLSETSVAENEMLAVNIYPNPARESASILAEDGLLQVTVYNLWGQKVETKTLKGTNRCVINTNDYPSGIYLVHLATENGVAMKRLLVE